MTLSIFSKDNSSLINDHHIHPFDQLTGDEIIRVASIVRKHDTSNNYIFNTITLKEPNKKHMVSFLGWDNSEPRVVSVEREAFVIVLEKETTKFFEGTVSLTSGLVKLWKYVPDVQAIFTLEEMLAVNNLVATDEKVRLECLELGIADMSQVFADPWSVARHNDYPGRGTRIMNALLYTRNSEEDNQYAHPLDFVVIVGKVNAFFKKKTPHSLSLILTYLFQMLTGWKSLLLNVLSQEVPNSHAPLFLGKAIISCLNL